MDSGITGTPSLDISARTVGGITIAELAGELDTASAPALREQLLSLLRPGSSGFYRPAQHGRIGAVAEIATPPAGPGRPALAIPG